MGQDDGAVPRQPQPCHRATNGGRQGAPLSPAGGGHNLCALLTLGGRPWAAANALVQ
jgi:hypothetical protein